MAVLKVKDKVTKNIVEAKVDSELLPKINQYTWIIDKHSRKPYREVKTEKYIRKHFLDREILECSVGDGRVVFHKNGDPLDCRKDNLIENQRIDSISSSGHHWPSTIRSMLNFIEKRSKEPEENICSEFLSLADIKRYSKKRIDIVTDAEIYEQFRKKDILPTLKKVLMKYFDWEGTLNITKDLTSQHKVDPKITQGIQVKDRIKEVLGNKESDIMETKETKETKKDKMLPFDKMFFTNKESENQSPKAEIQYDFQDQYPPMPTIPKKAIGNELMDAREYLYNLAYNKPGVLEKLTKDNKIWPTEFLIKALKERGAVTIQF